MGTGLFQFVFYINTTELSAVSDVVSLTSDVKKLLWVSLSTHISEIQNSVGGCRGS